MKLLAELWAYSPGEVAAIGAITIGCGLVLALLVIAFMSPQGEEEDEIV